MTLRRKLFITYGLVSVLFLLVTALAASEMRAVVRNNDELLERHLPLIEATDSIRNALGREYVIAMQALLVSPTMIDDDLAALDQRLTTKIGEVRRLLAGSSRALDEFERHYSTLREDLIEWQKAGTQLPPNRQELARRFAETRASAETLYQMNVNTLTSAARAANERARTTRLFVPLLGVVTVLLGAIASIGFVRRITAPLEDLARAAQRLGEGNFDTRVQLESRSDEINALATSFRDMAGSLQRFARLNVNKLIAERRRNDAVLESISDGLVILDEGGKIERLNPVAAQQLGPLERDPVGETFESLLGKPEIDAQIRRQLAPARLDAPPAPDSFDLRFERAGEQRTLSYSLMPFAEPGGTGYGLIMTLRDVTLEREFEAMRSSFVLRASHELRTPVTSIRMGLDLLSEKLALPEESLERELLDAVLAETQRMVRLLTDLLDLSRFQSGDQPLDKQPSDVAELLARAEQRFRSAAAEKGVVLGIVLPHDTLPPCRLDALQIDRVLDNLLSNALRHTQPGGQVNLRAQRYPEGIEISVTDTGEGIPIVQQSRIFKPFVQVGRHRGGAGLGLAIANEIVHQHGGEIVLNSAPNRGATFSVRLPT
jgi:NtrC-family two-component system sensor histidine kinase KinB